MNPKRYKNYHRLRRNMPDCEREKRARLCEIYKKGSWASNPLTRYEILPSLLAIESKSIPIAASSFKRAFNAMAFALVMLLLLMPVLQQLNRWHRLFPKPVKSYQPLSQRLGSSCVIEFWLEGLILILLFPC